MTERTEQAQPQYPALEEFDTMSIEDKVQVFTSLPNIAQQLLIRLNGFSVSISDPLFQFFRTDLTTDKVDKDTQKVTPAVYTPEVFDTAIETLLQGPFLNEISQLHLPDPNIALPMASISISERYKIAPVMREFITIDLRRIWEEQQRKENG